MKFKDEHGEHIDAAQGGYRLNELIFHKLFVLTAIGLIANIFKMNNVKEVTHAGVSPLFTQ